MTEPNDLTAWADAVAGLVRDLENAGARFRELTATLPPGGDPAERLAVLSDLLRRLGVDLAGGDAHERRGQQLQTTLTTGPSPVAKTLGLALERVAEEVERLAASGTVGPLVLAPRHDPDLKRARVWLTQADNPVPLAGVNVRSLPDGHPVKALLDPCELYQGTDLYLGRAQTSFDGSPIPPRLVWSGAAIALTRQLEEARREAEAARERERWEREAREEAERRRAADQDPVTLARRIAQLERQLAAGTGTPA